MIVVWVEDLIDGLRRKVGTTGFPRPADLAKMTDYLEEWVRVEYWEAGSACCVHRANAPAVAYIPEKWNGWKHDAALCEEVAHARLTTGMGRLLEQFAPGDPSIQRLARLWRTKDERLARAFVMAWFLPRELMCQYRPYEIVELSGCPEPIVRERLADLNGWAREAWMQEQFESSMRALFSAPSGGVQRPMRAVTE